MLKKLFSHLGVSLAIGWTVTTACMWSFGAWQSDGITVMRMYTVWLFASALYGLISLVYDTELPLPSAIAIHFIGCAAITFAGSWAAGLFSIFNPWPYWFIYVLPTFFVIYLIIGGVITVTEKIKEKRINKELNKG